LDTQRGAVLANELRNNACKLAKWTVQALLAGSDQIKFGYVQLLLLLLITKVAGYGLDYWDLILAGAVVFFLFATILRSALVPTGDR
jgi:hypothetical protein